MLWCSAETAERGGGGVDYLFVLILAQMRGVAFFISYDAVICM